MKIEYESTRRTGGGFVYQLKAGMVESIGHLHDGFYAEEDALGSIDSPYVLPGGSTVVTDYPIISLRFVGSAYVPREVAQ